MNEKTTEELLDELIKSMDKIAQVLKENLEFRGERPANWIKEEVDSMINHNKFMNLYGRSIKIDSLK